MTLTTRRLGAAIFFMALFAMAARVAVDSDTFWHLRAGTWMLDHGRLLNFDVFSHTRAGQPWFNHSWLAEIAMAAVFRAAGYGGLNLFTAAAVWLAFYFVYRSADGGSYLRAFGVLLAAVTSAVYWSARPQILSLVLTAVFTFILTRYRWRQVNRLWMLPPLMLLWANLHGGFAIGFVLLGLTLAGEIVSTTLTMLKAHAEGSAVSWAALKPAAWIGGIGLACAAAATANPFGPQLLLYPLKTVSIGALQNYIQEWQSPNFHAREAQVFIVMWMATFGAVGFSRRPLEATDFLLFAAFSAMALLAGRNIAAFAVVAAPILLRHADSIVAEAQDTWPRLKIRSGGSQPGRRLLSVVNWSLLVLAAGAAVLKVLPVLNPATTAEAVARYAPVGAASYLEARSPPGRMFNSYNYGGYLVWALYPDIPVYVDGRTDLYDDAFLDEYLNAYLARPGWEKTLEERGIDLVLVEPDAPLARELARRPEWALRYRDARAVVVVKTAGSGP